MHSYQVLVVFEFGSNLPWWLVEGNVNWINWQVFNCQKLDARGVAFLLKTRTSLHLNLVDLCKTFPF